MDPEWTPCYLQQRRPAQGQVQAMRMPKNMVVVLRSPHSPQARTGVSSSVKGVGWCLHARREAGACSTGLCGYTCEALVYSMLNTTAIVAYMLVTCNHLALCSNSDPSHNHLGLRQAVLLLQLWGGPVHVK